MRHWIGFMGVLGTLIYIIFMGGHTYQILEKAAIVDSTPKQVILLFSELSYAYVYLYFYSGGHSKLDKYLLIAVFASMTILFVGSGSKYTMMAMGVVWVLGNATSNSRRGFKRELMIVVASVIAIFAISYFVAAYRGELISRSIPDAEASVIDVVEFQFDVMTTAITNIVQGKQIGEGYYTEYDNSFILDRFAHLLSFAYFIETIGFSSPYENAYASLITPVFSVLPRFLLPNKVHFFDSGDFATKMVGWSHGGISITTPGSFFWAWGTQGIIAGMAGIGITFAWLRSRIREDNSQTIIWRTIMILAVVDLLDVGITFQAVIITATRTLILLQLLRWGVRKSMSKT
jgi:hypothetical protein